MKFFFKTTPHIVILLLFVFTNLISIGKSFAEAPEETVLGIRGVETILHDARAILLNPDDGVGVLVEKAVLLLQSGGAWEGRGRLLFRNATRRVDEIIEMVTPLTRDERPPVRALSCWWLGNAKVYRIISTLRIQKTERIVGGQRMREVMRELDEGKRAYQCAIDAFATEESYAIFGAKGSERYADTVRKNLIAIEDTQKGMQEQQEQGGQQPTEINKETEKKIAEALLGDIKEVLEEGDIEVEIIVPPPKGPPQEGYNPGIERGQ